MEILRALAVLAEPPTADTARVAAALGLTPPTREAHTELFVFELPPYASLYVGPDPVIGGVARDRVAGFWRALGGDPPVECDHLSALLGACAALEGAEWRHARAALVWEHLASWVRPYAAHVARLGGDAMAAWARLLREAVDAELGDVGDAAALPLHLREAPALPPPDAGAEAWIPALLTPARSGMILARADLARAAAALGLGLRAGDRRLALRVLFEQDAPAVAGWLRDEARAAAERHVTGATHGRAIDAWWAARASATAAALAR